MPQMLSMFVWLIKPVSLFMHQLSQLLIMFLLTCILHSPQQRPGDNEILPTFIEATWLGLGTIVCDNSSQQSLITATLCCECQLCSQRAVRYRLSTTNRPNR